MSCVVKTFAVKRVLLVLYSSHTVQRTCADAPASSTSTSQSHWTAQEQIQINVGGGCVDEAIFHIAFNQSLHSAV